MEEQGRRGKQAGYGTAAMRRLRRILHLTSMSWDIDLSITRPIADAHSYGESLTPT